MRAGNLHILAVFGNAAAGNIDAIVFLEHLSNSSHRSAEFSGSSISIYFFTLRFTIISDVSLPIGPFTPSRRNSSTRRPLVRCAQTCWATARLTVEGWNADFFRDVLIHHRLQAVDAFSRNSVWRRTTDSQNLDTDVLSLFDVFEEAARRSLNESLT
jgi:hypothetical protein